MSEGENRNKGGGVEFNADLIILDSKSIDVILGMD
jgi:hypothetical protein